MRIAYYRVSTRDQSVESQRAALGGAFDREFVDHGLSGATLAADRPGFSALLSHARKGDVVAVYAVDRLGRDSIDVQTTVRRLIEAGITVDVRGIGPLVGDVGKLVLAVFAQLAESERIRIGERTAAGKEAAREAFALTGKTHKGKTSLGGRPMSHAPADVAAWRRDHGASIAETAAHFAIGLATVKRYCAAG